MISIGIACAKYIDYYAAIAQGFRMFNKILQLVGTSLLLPHHRHPELVSGSIVKMLNKFQHDGTVRATRQIY